MAAVRFEDLAAGPSDRFLSRSMNNLSKVALDLRKQPTLADLGVASKSSRSPPPAAAPATEAASSAAQPSASDFINAMQNAFSMVQIGDHRRIHGLKDFSGGMEESWAGFQQDYELAAEAEGWSDDKKARQLYRYLKGAAKDYWAGLDNRYDWREVSRIMSAHFIPPEVSMFHADKLIAKAQGEKESLAEYAALVNQTLADAFPKAERAMREALLRLFFIRGLRPDYYFHVMSAVPGARDSYRVAYQTALNFESGKRLLQHNARLAHSAQAITMDQPQVFAGFTLAKSEQGKDHHQGGRRGKQHAAPTHNTLKDPHVKVLRDAAPLPHAGPLPLARRKETNPRSSVGTVANQVTSRKNATPSRMIRGPRSARDLRSKEKQLLKTTPRQVTELHKSWALWMFPRSIRFW